MRALPPRVFFFLSRLLTGRHQRPEEYTEKYLFTFTITVQKTQSGEVEYLFVHSFNDQDCWFVSFHVWIKSMEEKSFVSFRQTEAVFPFHYLLKTEISQKLIMETPTFCKHSQILLKKIYTAIRHIIYSAIYLHEVVWLKCNNTEIYPNYCIILTFLA